LKITGERSLQTLKKGIHAGLLTTWTLGKVIFPVTLLITILSYTPVLGWIVNVLTPMMGWLGLSGDAAIPLVMGNFLNVYAAIGAILTLEFTVKEVFILAVMLSFSHNLFIESSVAAKVGIKLWVVLLVRVGLALISAVIINLVWQGGGNIAKYGFVPQTDERAEGWLAIFYEGVTTASVGIFQLAIIVIPLMIGIQYMRDLGWLHIFAKWTSPFTKALGMKENTSTTLAAGIVFGLAFGAGVMIQAANEDGVSKKDLYLAFIFLVACHAVIEDTLIFIPLGIPVWPLLVIRLLTAVLLTVGVAYIWNHIEQSKRKEATYES
jgi:hypothetical protein